MDRHARGGRPGSGDRVKLLLAILAAILAVAAFASPARGRFVPGHQVESVTASRAVVDVRGRV